MAGGRPSSFKPEFVEQARNYCLLGATDQEIADFLGVHTATLYRWKLEKPEFCEALKAGKQFADDRVERSLFQKAVGYEVTEEQAVKIKVDQYKEKVEVVEVRKHVPADTTAIIFWAKNRQPDQWRDKREVEHSGGVKHTYDLNSIEDARLEELERILADAQRSEGGSGAEVAASVH